MSEFIGDYARLHDAEAYPHYGYVNDLIFRGGKIAATVVDPGVGFGFGYYVYPYYGYGLLGARLRGQRPALRGERHRGFEPFD